MFRTLSDAGSMKSQNLSNKNFLPPKKKKPEPSNERPLVPNKISKTGIVSPRNFENSQSRMITQKPIIKQTVQ
jgi:hypothetical protein